jgi:hypothetical protein
MLLKANTKANYEFSLSNSLKLVISITFYLAHPNLFLTGVGYHFFGHFYELNSVLKMIVVLRIFSIVVFFIECTRYYGIRVSRVLDIYAVKDKRNIGFAIKCLFKQNGLKTPVFMLVFGLTIITFL